MTSKTSEPTILFEDQHLVVISKPAGLLSQGEITGDENLVDWLRVYFGRNYVGLIHRLDRNTSGTMIVAKRSKAAQRLTDALQNDEIHRSYLAWVVGEMKAPARWSHFLMKDREKNQVRVVRSLQSGAQEAVLSACPLDTANYEGKKLTLVEYVLETGRSHQIRVQSAAEKFPVLGDRKYGKGNEIEFPRTALHSFRIRFPHPMSGEILRFESPLPKDFLKIKAAPKLPPAEESNP